MLRIQTGASPLNSNPVLRLQSEINELKSMLNAVVLAHYYQDPQIQDVADFIGDSLDLSRRAAETDADVIVFCGVHFMAETAKILSPEKTVLLPDINAGCSLADSCSAEDLRSFRNRYPDHIVLSYINCSAEVKAVSDIIVTSSSAEKILSQIPQSQPIIFAPDRNLGAWLNKRTGRNMELWDGVCIVHEAFNAERISQLLLEHPGAELIAHPECEAPLLAQAHFIGSTSALLRYTQTCPKETFIVATEAGILHQMQKFSPLKTFIPAPPLGNCLCNECPYMRMNTLEKVRDCMANMTPEITMSYELVEQALNPLMKMLEMASA